jgi:hypothetical protein
MGLVPSRLFDRWLPIVGLSVLGVFLSEVLSYNVSPLVRASVHGPAAVAGAIALAHLGYFALFAIAADVVLRWRIRDLVSLLLLGCLHGLVLEGIFAERIFLPAPGPSILGVSLVSVAYPALCWHPVLSFAGAFLILPAMQHGRLLPGIRRLWSMPSLLVAALALAWFSWSRAPWLVHALPSGIPFPFQLLWLAYPLLLGALTLHAVMNERRGAPQPPLLRWWHYPFLLAPVSLALLARVGDLVAQGRGVAVLGLLLMLAVYFGLLAGWLAQRKQLPQRSLLEEGLPPTAPFDPRAYARACVVIVGVWTLFAVLSQPFAKLIAVGCLAIAILGVLAAGAFPLYVLGQLVYRCVRKSR